MIVSLNEAEGMATKAAAGAGRPWGLAQEAGRAVAALEAMGQPGAQALLTLLKVTDGVSCNELCPTSTSGGTWHGKGSLCPILTGVYIADLGDLSEKVTLHNMHVPLLLVPFVGQCELAGDTTSAHCAELCVVPASSSRAKVSVVQSGPVDIGDEIWEALSAFAHRTYVPASEASRLKGAGAGLTDND
jgi:hypothetical protein